MGVLRLQPKGVVGSGSSGTNNGGKVDGKTKNGEEGKGRSFESPKDATTSPGENWE